MTILQSTRSRYGVVSLGSAVLGFLIAWPLFAAGQDKKDPPHDPAAKHAAPSPFDTFPAGQKDPAAKHAMPADKDLAEQIRQLNAKVVRLQAAVSKAALASGGAMPGMAADVKKPAMGMMDDDMMMGGMAGKKPAMPMMDDDMMMMDDMDMMGMGSMGGAKGKKMKMAAALPGFPGASHIYHIGATDFFLDHPEHITPSTEQKTKLAQMKQKATTAKASGQRKIAEAEQQLWELTAADQPDAAMLEAKVREIEKLRGDQRMAFIRSVGEAAQVLTDEQRMALLGTAADKGAKPDAAKTAQPDAAKTDPHAAHKKP